MTSLSPLVYDRNGELRAMCLRRGPYAEKMFAVELSACSSPLCECEEVTFCCHRLDYGEATRAMRVDIVLDLQQRSISSSTDGKRWTAEALDLAGELANEMSVEDWRDLYSRFYALKQAQTENADLRRLSAVFPPENMSDPSLMIAYKEIFPWGKAFDFTFEQEHWILDDQYCVNPACDCQEAIIVFLRLAVSADGQASVVQETARVCYGADRDAWEPMRPPWKDKPALETLVHALCEAHPTMNQDIRNRRQQLRTLYQAAVVRERPKRPLARIERQDIRPNDPCPCGSGKKFKKCCGRIA